MSRRSSVARTQEEDEEEDEEEAEAERRSSSIGWSGRTTRRRIRGADAGLEERPELEKGDEEGENEGQHQWRVGTDYTKRTTMRIRGSGMMTRGGEG